MYYDEASMDSSSENVGHLMVLLRKREEPGKVIERR